MIAIVLPPRATWGVLRREMVEKGQQVTGRTVVLTGELHGRSVALVRPDLGDLTSVGRALEKLGADVLVFLTYCTQLGESSPDWLGIVKAAQTSKGTYLPCDQEVVEALGEKARFVLDQIHWSPGFSPSPVACVLIHQEPPETPARDPSWHTYQELDGNLGDLVSAVQNTRFGALAIAGTQDTGRQRLTMALCHAIVTAFIVDAGAAESLKVASECTDRSS